MVTLPLDLLLHSIKGRYLRVIRYLLASLIFCSLTVTLLLTFTLLGVCLLTFKLSLGTYDPCSFTFTNYKLQITFTNYL